LKRIFVLGGYGGFGARLTRRLVARGHFVLVAGRSADKAAAFCKSFATAMPILADRNGNIGPLLEAHRPDLLIDAAGPFQNSGYTVPLACARAAMPYIDLADARDFVAGIAAIDAEAKRNGVAIISGASSVPALSGAVARHLADGFDTVSSVEIAITASNRTSAGPSVAAAILSYVGRPVRLWRGRRWTSGWGWQGLRRMRFAVDGVPALERRWVALADVPDHDILPALLPGSPAVIFRAGTELAVQTLGLWLLSWPVRWFGGSLGRLALFLLPLQRLTRRFGSDRSAMAVSLKGAHGEAHRHRIWTLIADDGDGPEIPVLAAELLAQAVLEGRVPAGACNAASLLTIDQFEPLFAQLAIRHAVQDAAYVPLYRRVMGARFDVLPSAVRAMHQVHGDGGAMGEATVERGKNPLAWSIAALMRFPSAGRHHLHVGFTEAEGVETWTRTFGHRSFTSHLSAAGGRLVERFGPLRFTFDLPSDGGGLAMEMTSWSFLRMRLPLVLAPRSRAREWQDGTRFAFDVPIALPLIGTIVHYRGWLKPVNSALPTGDDPR